MKDWELKARDGEPWGLHQGDTVEVVWNGRGDNARHAIGRLASTPGAGQRGVTVRRGSWSRYCYPFEIRRVIERAPRG